MRFDCEVFSLKHYSNSRRSLISIYDGSKTTATIISENCRSLLECRFNQLLMLHFFKKIASPFTKLKSSLGKKLKSLFTKPMDETSLRELEQILYEADLGSALVQFLLEKVRTESTHASSPEERLNLIRQALLSLFPEPIPPTSSTPRKPHVILFIGVNGSGKTTSLAKMGSILRKKGKSVLIAAGDTFRAAAVQQLGIWAERIGAEFIQGAPKGDSSSVAYDAIAAGLARGTDVILIDTAGRLQNKTHLMQELEKLRRVCEKKLGHAPQETLLILDATVGQNALDQARVFHQFTPITGIILTKLDGSAKGGIGAVIQKEMQIPIQWVGLGEGEEDLVPFDPSQYIDALLKV